DPAAKHHCCSQHGWCGSTAEHCNCRNCRDSRKEACKKLICGTGKCIWDDSLKTAHCRCDEGYHKDPSTGRCHECISHRHCSDLEHCRDNHCEDPCTNYCFSFNNVTCTVTNHQPLCSCPQDYILVDQKACQSRTVVSSTSSVVYLVIAVAFLLIFFVMCILKRNFLSSNSINEVAAFSGLSERATLALPYVVVEITNQ
ncbi:unnamed protein product, partial [Meganyctiphanes norvegica]